MNRVRELRVSHGLKQSDLAKMLNCAPTAISKYELGQLDLSSATIRALCGVFGCSSDYLLGLSDIPNWDLTPEEESLLLAWRRCDDRARDMVVVALAPFTPDESRSAMG